MQIHGRHYRSGEPVRVDIVGNVIGGVSRSERPEDELQWVAPAFFDPQINGHGGVWFSSDSVNPREILGALRPHFGFGVGRMFPTVITASYAAMEHGVITVRRACEMEPWADELVAGIHLEGPYISPQDGPRGAHPAGHVKAPDWEEFSKLQQASGNRIRLVTLAPEWPAAPEFIRRAVASGVTVAIGHTAACTDEIIQAVDAGATMSTHLGNGAHPVLPRHPNYLWDQLAEPRLAASVIPDGFHLPDSVLKTIIAVKGVEKTVVTCDASGLAGCAPGAYEIHGVAVEISETNRICVSQSPEILAGSAASTLDCVRHLTTHGIVRLPDAIDMSSTTPARLLGLQPVTLSRGDRADLIVFRADEGGAMEIVGTVVAGAVRYEAVL